MKRGVGRRPQVELGRPQLEPGTLLAESLEPELYDITGSRERDTGTVARILISEVRPLAAANPTFLPVGILQCEQRVLLSEHDQPTISEWPATYIGS